MDAYHSLKWGLFFHFIISYIMLLLTPGLRFKELNNIDLYNMITPE
jgi:hypothetical protein